MSASLKTWIRGAVWFCLLVFITGCMTPGSKPQLSSSAQAEALSHFSIGLLAEKSGDTETAFSHCIQALQIDPDALVLYPVTAELALRLNRPDEAIRVATQFRTRYPDELSPRILLGQVLGLTGQDDLAQDLLQDAVNDFPLDPKSHLMLARFLIGEKNYPETIQILETARGLQIRNPDILQLLGTLYIERARNYKETPEFRTAVLQGIQLLKEAQELKIDDPALWIQLGYAHLAVDEIEQAQASFEKGYALVPSSSTVGQQLLTLYIDTGNYQRALELCDELPLNTRTDPMVWLQFLVEKTPIDREALLCDYLEQIIQQSAEPPAYLYLQLSIIYLKQDKLLDAERILQNALEDFDEDLPLRSAAAYLFMKQEKYQKAFDAFSSIKADTPVEQWTDNAFFCINYIVAAQKTAHLTEACDLLSITYTNHPTILDECILALLNTANPESLRSAGDILSRLYQEIPDATELLYYLTLLHSEQQDYPTALETARQFILRADQKEKTKNLLDGLFYYQYAILHERIGQLENAERIFRDAMGLFDESTKASAQNYIAYMWAERGEKLEAGLELIQAALKQAPDNGSYIDTLGWIYYMQGRYTDALNELQKAHALVGANPEILEHLGDTYLKLGDVPAAIDHWKRALDMSPEDIHLIERIKIHQAIPEKTPDSTGAL